MNNIKSVVVFCGSSLGTEEVYEKQAYLLGQALAKRNIELVYGGAKVGLMGAVANGALSKGGTVKGVLPHFLQAREVAHQELTELILVESMHERKQLMSEMADGVIALPGGLGTLEELFEMLTWAQLGLHTKPVALLNTNGFYDALKVLIQTMVDKGFVKEENQQMLLINDQVEGLLEQMQQYKAPVVTKWITKDRT